MKKMYVVYVSYNDAQDPDAWVCTSRKKAEEKFRSYLKENMEDGVDDDGHTIAECVEQWYARIDWYQEVRIVEASMEK